MSTPLRIICGVLIGAALPTVFFLFSLIIAYCVDKGQAGIAGLILVAFSVVGGIVAAIPENENVYNSSHVPRPFVLPPRPK